MDGFAAFTALHFSVLLAIGLLTLIAVKLRRRRPVEPLRPPGAAERTIGLAYLAFWVATFVWLRLGPLYDPPTTYPLQLCHWCGVIAALVLLTAHPRLRALLYFWGLALCTQALLTPSLVEGPAQFPFWFFWITHGLIVGAAVYDLAARGYRPSFGDLLFACAATLFYAMVVLPIDLVMGWNYGFVGPSRPEVPSIVDFLGPWPLRLLAIAAIAGGMMALLWLPWWWQRRAPARASR